MAKKKYVELRGVLPRKPPEALDGLDDPAAVSLWDRMVDDFRGSSDELLTEHLLELRDQAKALASQVKACTAEIEAVHTVLLDRWQASGLESVRFGDHTFSIGDDLYPRVIDKPTLFAWLRGKGLVDLIKEEVHYRSLQSTIKELYTQGEDLPTEKDCGATVFLKQTIIVRNQ